MEQLDEEGRLWFPKSKSGRIQRKDYLVVDIFRNDMTWVGEVEVT